MDDDLQYREEIWAWDAQCAAVDERILTCPRCGSLCFLSSKNMNIWELDGKNGMNVPMPHVGIVAKYKLCKGEQNNETTKTNHS